jgi:hypothetical protein
MRDLEKRTTRCGLASRAGLASLDYVLILGVILPMVTFIMWIGPRIMRLAYEMVCVLISWPFM